MWPRFNDRVGSAAPIVLLHDDLQKWYPFTVRRQEDGKNPQEWVTRPATTKQQKYFDHAIDYTERAMNCYGHELWHEAATNFGSALESLLRIRFGSNGTLEKLVDKFDKDPLFDGIAIHEGAATKCATCFADKVRKLRNAVHPDCWVKATKKDVDEAATMVLMLYHVLVACGGSRIAAFQESPNSSLARMERSGISLEAVHQSQCKSTPIE